MNTSSYNNNYCIISLYCAYLAEQIYNFSLSENIETVIISLGVSLFLCLFVFLSKKIQKRWFLFPLAVLELLNLYGSFYTFEFDRFFLILLILKINIILIFAIVLFNFYYAKTNIFNKFCNIISIITIGVTTLALTLLPISIIMHKLAGNWFLTLINPFTYLLTFWEMLTSGIFWNILSAIVSGITLNAISFYIIEHTYSKDIEIK